MKHLKLILSVIAIVGIAAFSIAKYNVVSADDNQGQGEGESISSIASLHGDSQSSSESENKNGFGLGGTEFAIGSGGQTTLNGGLVSSVTDQTVSVTIFGLPIKAVVSSNTQVIGMGTSTLSSVKAGDVVDIKGTIDPSSGVINASTFRDRTFQTQNVANIQAQIQQLLALIRQLQAQVQGGQGGGN